VAVWIVQGTVVPEPLEGGAPTTALWVVQWLLGTLAVVFRVAQSSHGLLLSASLQRVRSDACGGGLGQQQ